MENRELIPVIEFCSSHQVDVSLLLEFGEHGLVEIVIVEEQEFIPEPELEKAEHMLRLYHDLEINMEGIEAIHHLLQKIQAMQDEIRQLRGRLNLYEKP